MGAVNCTGARGSNPGPPSGRRNASSTPRPGPAHPRSSGRRCVPAASRLPSEAPGRTYSTEMYPFVHVPSWSAAAGTSGKTRRAASEPPGRFGEPGDAGAPRSAVPTRDGRAVFPARNTHRKKTIHSTCGHALTYGAGMPPRRSEPPVLAAQRISGRTLVSDSTGERYPHVQEHELVWENGRRFWRSGCHLGRLGRTGVAGSKRRGPH